MKALGITNYYRSHLYKAFEINNFDTLTENFTEAENWFLFDEFNNISNNKLAAVLAQCGDKGDEDM